MVLLYQHPIMLVLNNNVMIPFILTVVKVLKSNLLVFDTSDF